MAGVIAMLFLSPWLAVAAVTTWALPLVSYRVEVFLVTVPPAGAAVQLVAKLPASSALPSAAWLMSALTVKLRLST